MCNNYNACLFIKYKSTNLFDVYSVGIPSLINKYSTYKYNHNDYENDNKLMNSRT